MGFNRTVDRLQRTAQGIIDKQDAYIDQLKRENAQLRARLAELEDESLVRKMQLIRNRNRH